MARDTARGTPEERPGLNPRGGEGTQRALKPPEGSTPEQIAAEREKLSSSGLLSPLFDLLPVVIIILNRHRQILYMNQPGLSASGNTNSAGYLGLRPGEAFDCVHAFESPDGYGASDQCPQCGLMLAAQTAECAGAGTFECHIMRRSMPDTIDFRLYTTCLELAGDTYLFMVGLDIGGEIRQRALERIFFHDLLNATGNIDGLAWLLMQGGEKPEQERCRLLLTNACRRLADEVRGHRDIFDAERGDLQIEPQPMEPWEFLCDLIEHYRSHPVARTRHVRLVEPPEKLPTLHTDPSLVGRVLGNLIKNALEATRQGDAVEVAVRPCNDLGGVEFLVWNPEPIPQELQRRLFTRAFSTKGVGRGLGTYGAKLITERYLGGSLKFVSTAHEGTTFSLSLPPTSPPSQRESTRPRQTHLPPN
ncbi:MAG: HAMP domain-containing histidine kinase [Candidatus Sumerlaeaceae bacterium]|nr:HAMP domain-containing histidine kinase [Candidatus Sumerlaeaceae bacterium]